MDHVEKGRRKKGIKKRPQPLVCEVVEVRPAPTDSKLRLCKVRWSATAGDLIDIATRVRNIAAGKKCLVTLPGATTANGIEAKEAKGRVSDSTGMLCGPKKMGWDTDFLDEALATMVSDTAEVGEPASSYDEAMSSATGRMPLRLQETRALP